ncbi:MAG: prepilin peptidase [Campylobacter sp.]|nr:prepilin peptidase [Campylobacter sp.]
MMILIAILGASLGSFCASLASRFSENFKLFTLRSFCFSCGNKLGIFELVPFFSYLFLKAKCKHCGVKIPFILFLSEIIGVFLLELCFYLSENFYDFLILTLFLFNLFLLSLIDIKLKAVPEFLLWSAFLFAFIYAFDEKEFLNLFVFEEFDSGFLVYAALFAGFMFLLKNFVCFVSSFKEKKNEENLGEADIIILSCMGGILGFKLGFLTLFIASILSLPFFLIQKKLAFIPFLSLAFIMVLFYKNLGI